MLSDKQNVKVKFWCSNIDLQSQLKVDGDTDVSISTIVFKSLSA